MTTPAQIDLWRHTPTETPHLEFKEAKSASVSQVIAATVDTGKIKLDDSVGTSRKLSRYLPYWA